MPTEKREGLDGENTEIGRVEECKSDRIVLLLASLNSP